jgi:hypothetical protein
MERMSVESDEGDKEGSIGMIGNARFLAMKKRERKVGDSGPHLESIGGDAS